MNDKTKFPRAVLFDYDGVLVVSEPIHILAWKQLLKEIDIPLDEEIMKISIGGTSPETITQLLDRYRPNWKTEPDGDKIVQKLVQKKNALYLQFAEEGLQVYPGVLDGLRWLKEQGVQVAIVSNGRRGELEDTSKRLGIAPFVQKIVSREDVPAHKPDPGHYLAGAKILGVSPEHCIAIEDSPTGLQSALRGGIRAGAVISTFPRSALEHPVPGHLELRPAWIGPSMEAFFDWLKSLQVTDHSLK